MKCVLSPSLVALLLAMALAPSPAVAHTVEAPVVFDEAYRAHILNDWVASQRVVAKPAPRKPVQVASSGPVFNLAALLSVSGFTAPAGNGSLMAASFGPFKPRVRFYWDGTTFYEESDNMPDNTMMPNLMMGITSWQQQIPVPASYFASTTNPEKDVASLGYGQPNYWRLPLVPVPSASPIPISSGNFQRGAVALAANGIAIFNPKNNTGRVSYEIGELDAYGGHCGLSDDYHYHIIPTHLLSAFGGVLGNDKPVAWALDGYPIYGYVEPDGTARLVLDADGGHTHGAWGYHYHAVGTTTTDATHPYGTPQSPYLMNNFHGTVVNYGGQVDGQPEVSGLRGSGTGGYTAQPVAGASIIAFKNPVALTTDGSGNLIENVGGTASPDQYLMRVSISGTSYDECWQINRNVNPKTMTVTWRLAGATTTTTYANNGNRLTPYPMAASSMTKLPDTSQVLDTTATFGEDADYTINAQSFTDNGDGTTTDNVTGLMWQKVDNGESTWETAVANAAGITTGAHNDWRLPTPSELFSLFNHNNGNPAALNATYFPNNPTGIADYWWTSDVYGTSTTNVWCSNAGGGLGGKPKTETISAGGLLRYHARYVRGTKPTNAHNYLNNGDGTITDLDTGLMWTQVPGATITWDAALSYAEGLTLGGYSDWRLPNIKELQTLTDYTLTTATSTTGIKPSINRTMFAKTLTGCATTLSSSTITCSDTTGLLVGMPIVDAADVASAYISNATPPTVTQVLSSTSFTVSAASIATGSGLTFKALAVPTAYWSSTSLKGDTSKAWLVETGINNAVLAANGPTRNSQGIISYEAKTSTYPVFAVRTTSVTTQIAVEQPSGTALTDGVSTVSYSNVNVGSSASKTFVIRNTGVTSLTITSTTIDGTNAANYGITTAPASSIAAGASTTMVVQFSAPSLGSKVATLHIASSDTAVGTAFDVTLSGTGYIPPPAVTSVTTNPTVPSNTDTPYITASVSPASGATIAQVQLTYSTGAVTMSTVFNETMAATATIGTGGWDGTGAIYPWTPVTKAGAGNIKQTTAANHTTAGAGNPCGLVLSKGSTTASDTIVTTTNAINAASTSAYVEFWLATTNLTTGTGWTFQVAGDGTTFTTRLSELTASIHGYQLYHYDLIAAERTSTLKIQFQFVGNGVGGPTAPTIQIDDITVVTTAGVPPVTVTMYDDGLHGDGAAGDGVYGVQMPAQAAGTTVSYSITATDSNASITTLSSAGSYTTGSAPSITTTSPLANGSTSAVYSRTLAASGGTPGYTWSISAGALPSGITLSATGLLSGTAATAGTYNFTVTVTDSAGRIATRAFALTIAIPPNVVIILTDDQGWGDIGYHTASGQVPVQTPNMDRLGVDGIRLEKFYATAVCAVTRSCLLTGRNTIRTACGNTRGLDLHEHLMPQTFKAAGYQTFMSGKWHIGGWDNNINTTTINGATIQVIQEGNDYLPHNRGWDIHKGQYGGAIGYFSHQSVDPGRAGLLDWWLNGSPVTESTDAEGNGGYSTDLLADKAVSMIQTRDKSKPMLLYLAFNGVHAGVQAPTSYINKYAALGVTDTTRRTLCAAVDCMDVAMGRVLTALDTEGITNNTLVVFMSDNGGDTTTGSINTPLRGTKGDSYDGGIHTPAAIRWPGVLPAGVTSNQYVWVGDIFPTICAATGVTPQNTKPFDGINLWPALLAASNSSAVQRPVPLVTATNLPVAFDTFTDPVNGGGKIFKLIRTKSGTTVTNQLFNMTDDAYETTDLLLGANASSYASLVTTLTADITALTVENYPPYIGAAPITQSVQQGGSITLYAPFTSYKAPTVQWRMNSANISGATSFYQVTDSSNAAVTGVYMATLTLNNLNSTFAGSYDVTVTNLAGSLTSQAGTLSVIHPISTLNDGLPDLWKVAHGIDPSSTAAANGPLGDLDHDGFPNLLEYAFNSDPTSPGAAPIQTSTAAGYLQLSYPRRISAIDLIYTPEVSTDLSTWSSDVSNFQTLSVTPNADGITETVTLRVLPAIASTAKKFARVKVTSL